MIRGMAASLSLALAIAAYVVPIAIQVLAVVFVPKDRRPATAAAWLLAIFLVPYVGLLAFLLFGSTKLPRRRRAKQERVNRYVMSVTEGIEASTESPAWPAWFTSLVALNRRLGAMPLVSGNTARLFGEYERSIHEMTAAVRTADTFVHVEFYILSHDATTAPFCSTTSPRSASAATGARSAS